MATEKVMQHGDIGVLIDIQVTDYDGDIVDLSSATVKQILLKKPSKAVLTKTAAFVSDGIDGRLKYSTVAGDIDEVGIWKIQVYVVMPSSTWRTEVGSFRVNANIDE